MTEGISWESYPQTMLHRTWSFQAKTSIGRIENAPIEEIRGAESIWRDQFHAPVQLLRKFLSKGISIKFWGNS